MVSFRVSSSNDYWDAGDSLGLDRRFAALVFVAGIIKDGLNNEAQAVREKMIECICPSELYRPPPNRRESMNISIVSSIDDTDQLKLP